VTPTPAETSPETSEAIDIAASQWAIKDRPLSTQDDALLHEWLSGDPRRRGALLRAQATWASLSRAKALGPSSGWGRDPADKHPSRRKLFMAASAIGGLAAAGVAGLVIGQNKAETITDTGEIRRLPMSDGSVAAINTDSAIKVSMTDTQRKIDLLRGEVWFRVAKNKYRPFIVSAGLARVQAVAELRFL
jgi:transmembrane sensor